MSGYPKERRREIDRRVSARYLGTRGDRWAYHNDAQYHADMRRLRDLIAATDAAMAAEGIGEETRDRALFRVLYGEPPEVAVGPDWREAAGRVTERELEMRRRMETVEPLSIPDEWKPDTSSSS